MTASVPRIRPLSVPPVLCGLRHSSLLQSVAVVSVIAGVAWSTIGVFYDTNDDPSLRLILEGHWVPGGRPEGHLFFVNAGLGHALIRLYELAPGVAWYDVLMVGSVYIACIALVYALLFSRPLDLAIAAGLGLVYFTPLLVRLQFTAAAGTVTCAGMMLLLRCSLEKRWTGGIWTMAGAGLVLVFLGSLIRLDSAASVLLLGSLLALPILLDERNQARHQLRSGAALAGLSLVFVFGGAVLDRSYYRETPGWDSVHADGTYRVAVTEYLPGELRAAVLPNVLTAAGWSEADYLVYENWLGTAPEVFGLEHLKDAHDARQLEVTERYVAIDLDRLRAMLSQFRHQHTATLMFLPLLGLFWYSAPVRIPALALILGSVGLIGILFNQLELTLCVLALMVMLPRSLDLAKYSLFVLATVMAVVSIVGATVKEPPWRITAPLVVLGATYICFLAARSSLRPRWPTILVTAVIAIAMTFPRLQFDHFTARSQQREHELVNARAWQLRSIPENTYLVGYEGGFDLFTYWQPFQLQEPPFRSVYLSWANTWPVVRDYLRATGRTDLPYALCTDPTLRWIGHSRAVPALERYVYEHHGARVEYVVDPEFSEWAVYKCQGLIPENGAIS